MAEGKTDFSAGDPLTAAQQNQIANNANDGGGFRDDLNAGTAITAFQPVFINPGDNEWWNSGTLTTARARCDGIALENGTDGNPLEVQTSGIVRGLAGLTEGAIYYAPETPGNPITTTKSEIMVGVALSSTELLITKMTGIDGETKIEVVAGESISPSSAPVPIFQNTSDNEFYACDANDSTKLEFAGFAFSNGVDGGDMLIQVTGIVSGFLGLAEGELYYVQDAVGTIGTTPGTVKIVVGRAISTTELLIEKVDQLELGDRKLQGTTADVVVASSTSETDLVSFTVPAHTLSTANIIEFRLFVSVFGLTTTKKITIRLKYGGTTIATLELTQGNNTPIAERMSLYGALYASGATNTQEGVIEAIVSNDDISGAANGSNGMDTQVGTAAEDSTGALDLKVTAQFNNSSASDKITVANSYVKLIK